MISFPERLNLAQTPTPFQLLERVSRELKVNVWMKRDDLTGITLSGNKVRKLEFTLAKAIAEGCDSIITCGGLQSNHCRATAYACAQLGLKCSLVLRGTTDEAAEGNLFMDQLAGANITTYAAGHYARNLPQLLREKAEQLTREGMKPYIIPTGASDGTGIWGYIAAVQELSEDFKRNKIDPTHIVCATGSGGTQAGLTLGCELMALDTSVIGFAVCDDEAYFQNKVRADVRQWIDLYGHCIDVDTLPVVVNDNYIGPGYARADSCVFETIAWLAKTEGIVLDPVYTGKAFYGLIEEIRSGRMSRAKDIVFVHTGGIFGVFPQRSGFSF